MEHLDDHIREQFQLDDPASRFPVREEHWAQALALIEAAERKRRRGLLWWWFAGLLLLGGGWWAWQQAAPVEAASLGIDRRQPGNPGAGSPIGEAVQATGAKEQTASSPSAVEPAADHVAVSDAGLPSVENKMANVVHPKVFPAPLQAVRQKGDGGAMATQQQAVPVVQDGLPTRSATANGEKATSDLAQITFLNSATLNNRVTEPKAEPSGLSVPPQHRSNFSRLPTRVQVLSTPSGGFGLAQVPYNFPRIKPVRAPVIALGLHASATLYSPKSAQPWGMTVGGAAEYWFRPAWSLSAGLAWRNQPAVAGPMDTSAAVRQLRYRFGYEEESFHRADRRLHFLEVPLGLHWHQRGWQLEAGVTMGRLVGVRAVQIETSRSSLAPLPVSTESRIQGSRNAYRRDFVAPFAGFAWQPLRRWQLAVRATYRPASVLRPTEENAASAGTYWLDAGLRWQLCSHDRTRLQR